MLIRQAVPEDAKSIAKVHIDTWKSTYRGIVPDEYLAGMSYERREAFWEKSLTDGAKVYVAEEEGNIIGFATGGKIRGEIEDYEGELYAIYILKEFQQRGIGKALTHAVVKQLLESGIHSMLVWVLKDNPSRQFYEALGGVPVKQEMVEIGGAKLEEIAYGWRDLHQISW